MHNLSRIRSREPSCTHSALFALTVLSLHSQCCSPACTRELSGLPLGNTNTYAADHSPLPHTDERT